MPNDLIYYEYINDLCDTDIVDEKLLRLFSVYISSNRDFKYNATYLIDSIEKFKDNIAAFQRKREKVIRFAEILSKQYVTPCNWIIILDDVFIIDDDFNFSTLTTFLKENDFSNNKLQRIEGIAKYHLKLFNLFAINCKTVKSAYYNLADERKYTHIDVFQNVNALTLSELVESDYVKRKINEE